MLNTLQSVISIFLTTLNIIWFFSVKSRNLILKSINYITNKDVILEANLHFILEEDNCDKEFVFNNFIKELFVFFDNEDKKMIKKTTKNAYFRLGVNNYFITFDEYELKIKLEKTQTTYRTLKKHINKVLDFIHHINSNDSPLVKFGFNFEYGELKSSFDKKNPYISLTIKDPFNVEKFEMVLTTKIDKDSKVILKEKSLILYAKRLDSFSLLFNNWY
ncbi:hypothetical protein [Marinitoga sp. 1155]|uniref:hypothetical protein n=1 Tax=Marinitoga sp. 1155 TaxID=1428448 RepID=UPI0006412D92|nr:hypothetical protein [Marinitoga sp. 1155]KLO24770.1 hypothetical protein X274_02090 [Marinitoga sp. 1155]